MKSRPWKSRRRLPAWYAPKKWYGQNWIKPAKRLAIYIRDGLACVYCGHGIEAGSQLSLDHLREKCRRGTNDATNLVTACMECNTRKADTPLKQFVTDKDAMNFVLGKVRQPIDIPAAKKILAVRKTVLQSVQSIASAGLSDVPF